MVINHLLTGMVLQVRIHMVLIAIGSNPNIHHPISVEEMPSPKAIQLTMSIQLHSGKLT